MESYVTLRPTTQVRRAPLDRSSRGGQCRRAGDATPDARYEGLDPTVRSPPVDMWTNTASVGESTPSGTVLQA